MSSDTKTEQGPEPGLETHEAEAGPLHLHKAHATVPIPFFTPRDVVANARMAGSLVIPGARQAGSRLASEEALAPRKLAFYGGLGALAFAGAIEWPVAAAIGAATVVAGGRKRKDSEDGEPQGGRKPQRKTAAKSQTKEKDKE